MLERIRSYSYIDNTFNSILNANNSDGTIYTNATYQNNLNYTYQLPNVALSLSYLKEKKYGFGLLFNTQYYDVTLDDKIRNVKKEDQNLIFAPIIKFLYGLNSKSNIVATYSYNEIVPSEDNLFEGIVLTGFRNFRNNTPDITFLDTHTYNLIYNYNDVFKITRFSISLNHSNKNNNYFSRSSIDVESIFNIYTAPRKIIVVFIAVI